MNFLISEYIALLKEDNELDVLLVDILKSKSIVPISKPQKGRQYGVDIAAIGKDKEGVKKLFLITVKQGNITRSVWDSGINSVRQSLNEIIETYISISLTSEQKKLPIKIILATNGNLNQPVQIPWSQFTQKNEKDSLKFEFWGIDDIAEMVSEGILSERFFDDEMRSLLKKTLSFLELKDYNLNHYNKLVVLILENHIKTKKVILKRLKLLQICLNIVFKWAQDSGYIKSVILAADKTIIEAFKWITEQNFFKKDYVKLEFYNLNILRRKIGIAYFNKVNGHHSIEHSFYGYSRNQVEYSLCVWEEIGIIANIGLTEITQYKFHFDPNNPNNSTVYEKGAMTIAESLISLIKMNPPSHFPLYDNHLINIEPALRFLYLTGHKDECLNWLRVLIVGIHDNKVLKNFFPLFHEDHEKLIDSYLGRKQKKETSSMLLTLLLDWSAILNSKEAYEDVRKVLNLFEDKLNLQIWFPKEETEMIYLECGYSKKTGAVKHSILLYDQIEDYQKEINEEIKLFCPEKEFEAIKNGYDLIFTVTSQYHKELPFPFLWRRLLGYNLN